MYHDLLCVKMTDFVRKKRWTRIRGYVMYQVLVEIIAFREAALQRRKRGYI